MEDVEAGSEDAAEGLVDAGECQGNFEEPLVLAAAHLRANPKA